MITVIGRGHSGTSAIAETLYQSGVFMGYNRSATYDLVPAESMYQAAKIAGSFVRYIDNYQWDFSWLTTTDPPEQFTTLVMEYLQPLLTHAEPKGWKLPETTLMFPWIVKLFPDIKYIHWVRDPRDNILGPHITDDLKRFGIPYPHSDNHRAVSWKYQDDIVKATPQPENFMAVRFEDFVLKQDETLERLEDYLEMKLAKIPVRKESVGRHIVHNIQLPFLQQALLAYNYS